MVLPETIERHLKEDFDKGAIESIATDPMQCVFYCCCQPCAVYAQRQDMLQITGEPYVCCAGVFPCLGFEKPVTERAWLMAEACCCLGCAQAGNRFMVQTRLNRRNSKLDHLLKIFNEVVSCEFMLLRLCTECSNEREDICKGACCVCPCTHCQNAVVISEYKNGKKTYETPSNDLIEELPVHFTSAGLRKAAEAPVQMQPM
jgi:hypothetical protein